MKQKVQLFGRFLSGMVMPNIGAFIAWGLITALFIADGWFPNKALASVVDPMLKYLLPILIGYTGGKAIHDVRGGVVGAIATFGVVMGADVTMLIGAMIVGPLGGWVMKRFDKAVEGRIPNGFEMLVNNFSAGILGMILLVIGFLGIGPVVEGGISILAQGVSWLVTHQLLPLTSILVEPAKVLFLNNAINHGIFTPLGAEQIESLGKSVLYLIESNPGPGLGLLLAFMVAGKGVAKSSASGAAIIHFFGGVHELYFPYVLMKPILLLATIAGSATGVFIFTVFGGGLTGASSPGSIIAVMMMTPSDALLPNLLGIGLSVVVTFVIAVALLRASPIPEGEDDLAAATAKMASIKGADQEADASPAPEEEIAPMEAPQASTFPTTVTNIIFACDAGMGSSAMGASKLRKKLKNEAIEGITVKHSAVNDIPAGTDVVVTHIQLKDRAIAACPAAHLITITDFLSAPEYDTLITNLKEITQ